MIVFLWFAMVLFIVLVSFVFLGFTVRSWSRDKKAALAAQAAGLESPELNK
ncbi:hypothetical protein D3C72_1503560 [compost metagenome]